MTDELRPIAVANGIFAVYLLDPLIGAVLAAPLVAGIGWRLGVALAERQANPRHVTGESNLEEVPSALA